jgi:hypothetical protein
LLNSLHSILHTFLVAAHVLTFEQGYIKFSETVAEVNANKLRVSSAPVILYKTGCFGVNKITAGSEDIAPVGRDSRCILFYLEVFTYTKINAIVGINVTLRCA